MFSRAFARADQACYLPKSPVRNHSLFWEHPRSDHRGDKTRARILPLPLGARTSDSDVKAGCIFWARA